MLLLRVKTATHFGFVWWLGVFLKLPSNLSSNTRTALKQSNSEVTNTCQNEPQTCWEQVGHHAKALRVKPLSNLSEFLGLPERKRKFSDKLPETFRNLPDASSLEDTPLWLGACAWYTDMCTVSVSIRTVHKSLKALEWFGLAATWARENTRKLNTAQACLAATWALENTA